MPDVVIVGSGVAGALLADRLARKGRRVLILEAGARVDRASAARAYAHRLALEDAYPQSVPGPSWTRYDDYYQQTGPTPFTGYYERVVGGSTWHWLGTCLRMLPNDLRLRSRYGVGVDWPIEYDELEPYYGQAEVELGVSGDSVKNLGSPRSSPFPMPASEPTVLDRELGKAAGRRGYPVVVLPAARNTVAYDGRPACCGSATCVPICPIGAKYDATVHLERAMRAGAELWTEAQAVRIAGSRVECLDGRAAEAPTIVVAANPIESVRLLLMSGHRHPQLGRNLMGMYGQISWALAPRPVWPFRSPQVVSGIVRFRDGAERKQRAAFFTSIGNDGWPHGAPPFIARELIEKGLHGKELKDAIFDHCSRQLLLVTACEELPDPQNRVSLGSLKDARGLPRPAIDYRIGDYTRRAIEDAVLVHARIFDEMGATIVNHVEESADPAHLAGTCGMGRVVDENLQSYEQKGLYVLGSSVFPTVGTAPPTLTIAALALRLADHLSH